MTNVIADLMVRISSDYSGAQKGLDAVDKRLSGLGKSMMKTGGLMTAGLTLPIVAGFGKMSSIASDFESQVNILGVAAKSSGTPMKDLADAAVRVGADTELVGISASQAADAMTIMYKQGLTTSDMFGDLNGYLNKNESLTGALRAAVDLAAGSELDLASASDTVAIAMNTFNLSAEDAIDIADSFVKYAGASAASVGDLKEAMIRTGPIAGQMGMSLDETNAALAILANRGIRGADAGGALNSMLMNMSRQTNSVQDAWADMGVSMYDAEGNMRNIPDVIADISKATAGMTDEQRDNLLMTIAGSRGIKALNILLDEGTTGFSDMAAGAAKTADAQEVAGARTKGLAAAMEQMQGAFEAFMITAGTPLIKEVITPLVKKLTDLIGKLVDVNPTFLKWGAVILGVVAAAGPLITGIGMFISGFGAIISIAGPVIGAIGGIGGAIALLSNPIGWIIAAVAALAAAWATDFLGIRTKTLEFVEWLKPYLADAWEWVTAVFQKAMEIAKNVISDALSWMKSWWAEYGDDVMAIVGKLWEWTTRLFDFSSKIITTIIQNAIEIITAFWEKHGETIMYILGKLWDYIKLVFDTGGKAIGEIISMIRFAMEGDWEGLKDAFHRLNEVLWSGMIKAFEIGSDILKRIFDELAKSIVEKYNEMKASARRAAANIMNNLKTGIENKVMLVVNVVYKMKDRIIGALRGATRAAYNSGKSLVSNFANGIRSRIQDAINAANSLAWQVRQRLPFSDAKKGPLSDISTSGKKFVETFAGGMHSELRTAARLGDEFAAAFQPKLSMKPAPAPTTNTTINLTIQNPQPATSEDEIQRSLRTLAWLGVLPS